MWGKSKKMLLALSAGSFFLYAGISVNAAEANELKYVEEVESPQNIPLTINLSPQNVNKSNVTSHTVVPKINWYDGVSNSFTVGYTNAYGQRQLSQKFTSFNVVVAPTTYSLTSGSTRFEGRHSATVSSIAGSTSMTGTIVLNRR